MHKILEVRREVDGNGIAKTTAALKDLGTVLREGRGGKDLY
jgi:hypothetical protein